MEQNKELEVVENQTDSKNENKSFHPVIIIGIVIVILYIISFLPSELNILGIEIKPVDILIDVKQ